MINTRSPSAAAMAAALVAAIDADPQMIEDSPEPYRCAMSIMFPHVVDGSDLWAAVMDSIG